MTTPESIASFTSTCLIAAFVLFLAYALYAAIRDSMPKETLTRGDILNMKLSVMKEVHEQEMAMFSMEMYCEDKKDVVSFVSQPLFGGVVVNFHDGTSYNTSEGRNFDEVIKEKREEMKLNEVTK